MKLLTQSGLYMVTLSLALFFACGIAFYFVFKAFTNQALDRELEQMKIQVLQNPDKFITAAREDFPFFDKIEFIPDSTNTIIGSVSLDTAMILPGSNNPVPMRFIQFESEFKGDNFLVRVYRSKISSDDLTVRITGLFTLLALFFTAGIFLLNRYGFRSTWRNFWLSLQKVQDYKAGKKPPDFEESEIDEFEALNQELKKMTGRIYRDYNKLESFTSHTTHEFQTPLAVIRSKVELLLQSENLSTEQLHEIQSIDKYARQLSRLNQSLSLLFKIENQQYGSSENLNLAELINQHIDFLNEQAEIRGINVETIIDGDGTVSISLPLADILILNLFRNALFHNIPDGKIEIELRRQSLRISNTGNPPDFDHSKVFGEFVKSKSSNGLGLGLAIVRKICDQYGIDLDYAFNDHRHSFLLVFPS